MSTEVIASNPGAAAHAGHEEHLPAGAHRLAGQAAAPASMAQSGHVRRLRRQHLDDVPVHPGARRPGGGAGVVHPRHHALAVVHGAVRQLRRSGRRRPQQSPGGGAACGEARRCGQALERGSPRRGVRLGALDRSAQRRRVPGRSRRSDPGRWTGHRGRRIGGRKRDHRRVRSCDPRVGRRFLLRHRRHQGVVRLARGARHGQPRRGVPRSHDQHGRERAAPEDAERDRVEHPAGQADPGVSAGDGDVAPVFDLQRRGREGRLAHHHHRARSAAGVPDPDHHRRAAVRDRPGRHWPHVAGQRDRHFRTRGGGRGRRRRPAARQDRDDHAREPAGHGVPARSGLQRAGTGRCGATCIARRRNARRSQHRRPREAEVRPART